MKHNTEFEKIQAEWDKKLKESGFVDQEQRDGRLKSWSNKYKTGDPVRYQAKEEYYRAAGQFLYDHKFERPVERRIWELHSQGMARLNIVKALRAEKVWYRHKRKDSRPNSFGVQKVIESLRDLMISKIEYDRQNSKE